MNFDTTGFITSNDRTTGAGTGMGDGISTGTGNGRAVEGIDTTGGCWRAGF